MITKTYNEEKVKTYRQDKTTYENTIIHTA